MSNNPFFLLFVHQGVIFSSNVRREKKKTLLKINKNCILSISSIRFGVCSDCQRIMLVNKSRRARLLIIDCDSHRSFERTKVIDHRHVHVLVCVHVN